MIVELFPHITLKTLHGDSELSRTSAPWAIGARTRIQAGLFSHITAKINRIQAGLFSYITAKINQ